MGQCEDDMQVAGGQKFSLAGSDPNGPERRSDASGNSDHDSCFRRWVCDVRSACTHRDDAESGSPTPRNRS
jgi:hypothetical protein